MENDMEPTVQGMNQILAPPYQVVQRVLDNQWTFAANHFPSEIQTDKEPPFRLGDDAEVIPIDEFLGKYDPAKTEITIYTKGIQRAAGILKVREYDLTILVRLHEWGHALVHIGLSEADRLDVTRDDSLWRPCLEKATDSFVGLDNSLHERLAQLIVLYGIRDLQEAATIPEAKAALARIDETFRKLRRRSPSEYQIDDYLEVPRHRIAQSIGLLKDRTLLGSGAWDIVVRW